MSTEKTRGTSVSRITTLIFVFAVAGCAQRSLESARPNIDLSPLDCGYKWFQTGYSSDVLIENCAMDRSVFRDSLSQKAVAHAWEVGALRCPMECPPQELKDTVEWDNPLPDGSCKEGRLYYLARVFLQCTN